MLAYLPDVLAAVLIATAFLFRNSVMYLVLIASAMFVGILDFTFRNIL